MIMEKIDLILNHPIFVENIDEINKFEKNRKFCTHGLSHFLDVARIAALLNKGELDIEIIYAAALLHDIGRGQQYEAEKPHEQASAELAEIILKDCGFCNEVIEEIVYAILCHNKENDKDISELGRLLYMADKASRNCFMCAAIDECKWPKNKKNKTIIF